MILFANQNVNEQNRQKICDEVFATVPLVIYTTKNFWLLEGINEKIGTFKAAGLMDFWYFQFIDREKSRVVRVDKAPKILSLGQFQGCFLVLLSGLGLGLGIFVMEIAAKKGLLCLKVMIRGNTGNDRD
jgi:hypothetical protein